MFESKYKSAMSKISPTDDWKKDTLAKMRKAQEDKNNDEKYNNTVKFNKAFYKTKRAKNLIKAAVVILIALPAAYVVFNMSAPMMMSDSTTGEMATEVTMQESAPQETLEEAATPQAAQEHAQNDEQPVQNFDAQETTEFDAQTESESAQKEDMQYAQGDLITTNGTLTQITQTHFTLVQQNSVEMIFEITNDTLWGVDKDEASGENVQVLYVIDENNIMRAVEIIYGE